MIRSKMNPQQAAAWESVLRDYCESDDPVHICGDLGCVRIPGQCVRCAAPGGAMTIGVTAEQWDALPSA